MDRRAAILNFWVNDPTVLPAHAPGFAYIDASSLLDNPRNLMLEHDHGVSVWFYKGGGIYEGHYLFGPKLRGKEARTVAQAHINSIFTQYHAETILGQTPAENRPARLVSRSLGFVPYGRGSVDTFNRPCVDYVLTRKEWQRQSWALKV